ncbi:MAG: restriction endonuclease subunit S [Bacteroidales bacterium]|jgi:type I restriction enzyme S subunit|nr:restriction endonuclease subunit S [Bacteroidales bacterium]
MSWEKKKLGDLCSITKGKIGINKAIPGVYPLVVTSEERKSHNEIHFEGEAVIIPLVSSTGHGHRSLKRIHYQTGKFAVGNILCAVIPNDSNILNAEFLYRFLDLNREKELVSRMRGMANVTLPMKEIANIEIPLPPLEEQRKFVDEYKELETANNTLSIEITNQLNIVKQLRQAFLREAMQGKLIKQNETDEPATELLAKIKSEKEQLIKEKKIKKQKPPPPISEDEIPFEIPENWTWCRLGLISDFISGNNFMSGDFTKNDGAKCIKITNAGIGEIIETDDRLPIEFIDKYPNYLVYENDLVLALTRPYISDGLKISKCSSSYNNSLLNQRVAVIRTNKRISNEFIYSYMKSGYVLSLYKSMFTDKGQQPNLRKDHVTDLYIPLPPLSEQKRIVAKLDELMAYCESLEESIKNSQSQNEMLLGQVLREALEPKEKEVVA